MTERILHADPQAFSRLVAYFLGQSRALDRQVT